MTTRHPDHKSDHPWAGICLAPGCDFGHDVLDAEERDRIAREWLAANGWTLIPTEELAGLRAIEEAARDADPTPGQAITSAPAIAALRAALAAKGPRP